MDGIVPTDALNLSSLRAIVLVGAHNVLGEPTQSRQILWPVALAGTSLTLAHDDVEDSVQAVFDVPVGADDIKKAYGRERFGEDEIAAGCGRLCEALTGKPDLVILRSGKTSDGQDLATSSGIWSSQSAGIGLEWRS